MGGFLLHDHTDAFFQGGEIQHTAGVGDEGAVCGVVEVALSEANLCLGLIQI